MAGNGQPAGGTVDFLDKGGKFPLGMKIAAEHTTVGRNSEVRKISPYPARRPPVRMHDSRHGASLLRISRSIFCHASRLNCMQACSFQGMGHVRVFSQRHQWLRAG